MKELDSNNLKSKINNVCSECGISANVLTCFAKFGAPPKKLAFDTSTFHKGKCDYCGETKMITEARDFFYPNFSLLKNHAQDIAQALKTQHTEIVEAVERLKIPPITGNSPAELIANEGVFRRNQALDDVLQAITQPTN